MNTDYSDEYYPTLIFSPYPSPVQAFINYMNVLADFKVKLSQVNSQKGLKESVMDPAFKKSIQTSLKKPKIQKKVALSLSQSNHRLDYYVQANR